MPFLWGEPSCAVLPGSLPGTLLGKVLPKMRKEQLPTMFWLCSIGVNSVIKASGMAAVVLALLVGLFDIWSATQVGDNTLSKDCTSAPAQTRLCWAEALILLFYLGQYRTIPA